MARKNASKEFDENAENYRPWSELPYLILISITHHLLSLSDLISFSHVCRHWRSSISFSSIPPLLLSRRRIHTITLPISKYKCYITATALEPKSFMGFSHGFLIYLEINKPILLNPLTLYFMVLPCLTFEKDYSFAALTSPISSNRSALLVFTSSDIFKYVFIGGGNIVWHSGSFEHAIRIASVVTLKNGKVLAINDTANAIVEFVINDDHSISTELFDVKGIDESMVFDKSHFGPNLVECGGDLLLVLFVQSEENGYVVKINVYKLDLERKVWLEVKKLVDYAIFIDCARRCGYSCYKMEKWGHMNDCLYMTGPGAEWYVQLPIGGMMIPQWSASNSMVSDNWMKAPRWPSPFWIHPL